MARVTEQLIDHGIRLRNYVQGNHGSTCPQCSAGRKPPNRKKPCLSVLIDGDGATWNCKNCDWKGGVSERRADYQRREPPKQKRKPTVRAEGAIHDKALAWFTKRGISRATLERNKVFLKRAWMPGVDRQVECVCFPYFRGGELVNVKYRTTDKRFRQEKDCEKVFFGLDNLQAAGGDGPKEIIIVEGEMDALSLNEAGIWNVLSVPDGAPKEARTDPIDPENDAKFEYVWNCRSVIDWADKVILATDADGPGRALEDELARRIGKAKCWRVAWPCINDDERKDANEVLVQDGAEVLRECIEQARPYPITSLFDIGKFESETIQLFREGHQRGFSTGFSTLDDLMTIVPGQMTVVTGYPSSGKALAVDTPVPISSGWTTMGRLGIGDSVYDEQGNECRVVAATVEMLGRTCYRLRFSDGADIIADADHRWYSEPLRAVVSERGSAAKRGSREWTKPRGTDQRWKRARFGVFTTAHIAGDLNYAGKKNHRVPLCRPLKGTSRPLPIPPYTLGAWLGDGHSKRAAITSADVEILNEIRLDGFLIECEESSSRSGGKAATYLIRRMGQERQSAGWGGSTSPLAFENDLKLSGVYGNKHIPPAYLRASVDDRQALLCGLMDTDGYCGPTGTVEFCSTKESLARGTLELMLTLGIKATIREGVATLNGRTIGPKWRVLATPASAVFRLRRKLRRQNAKPRSSDYRTVVSCEPVASVPVRCIQVDSPNGLFLCSHNFIPTHNSEFVDALCINMAESHDWKFAVCSFEKPPAEHIAQWAEKHLGQPFWDGPTARMGEGDLMGAIEWIGEHFFLIRADDETPTIDWVLDKAKAAVMRYGIRGLVMDPYNEFEHKRPGNMSETEYIAELLAKVKRFAQAHDVHVWFVAHPAKPDPGSDREPGLYSISGSAHWNNKADIGIVVHRGWLPDGQRDPVTQIHVKKVRFRWVGAPGKITLSFDQATGQYSEAIA